MVKEYLLQGLDCPNCANKIEQAVNQLPGLTGVSLNFMTGSLVFEIIDPQDEEILISKVEDLVHKYEPDVEMVAKLQATPQQASYHKSDLIQIGLAILGLIATVLWEVLVGPTKLAVGVYLIIYLLVGGEIIWQAAKNISRGQVFDENFLMSLATFGALAIGEYREAVAVMLFYRIGEFFQELAVNRSKQSISDLMDIRPDYANLKCGDDITRVKPELLQIGDVIVVKPGEKIPVDGILLEGRSNLDTRALTGESLPRLVAPGDALLSGCVNLSGLLTVEVTKLFSQSTVSKIIDLVENAGSRKAATEKFISRFSRYYTPAVVLAATLVFCLPPLLFSASWRVWLGRSLIFLVISCPCALVVSIPLSFYAGIGAASRAGILVKGSNFLEGLGELDTVVFDKTGTLTQGVFQVSELLPAAGYSQEDLLRYAGLAEAFSGHPIANSIRKAYQEKFGQEPDKSLVLAHQELAGLGLKVQISEGELMAGNRRMMQDLAIDLPDRELVGTVVYIALNQEFIGRIVIADRIKADTASALQKLRDLSVKQLVMMTGDNKTIAEDLASELELDAVYSQLLPDQKVSTLEELAGKVQAPKKLAFVGDGINDAPVLARADIGIAMGGLGSDAAIEAADIVLMKDTITSLVTAIEISSYTRKIVWQNISFALLVKVGFLVLGALGIAGLWEAVFADVGVTLLAVLNSMRILRRKYNQTL